MIRKGTLALKLAAGSGEEGWISKEWDINDRKAVLAIRKA